LSKTPALNDMLHKYRTTPYLVLILITFTLACTQKAPVLETYTGHIAQDSVALELQLYEKQFYGKLHYYSGKQRNKTGEMLGEILGDTLLGDYHYSAYGAQRKRAPIALLRTASGGYSIGQGVASAYMGIPYYVKNIPITYDTLQLLKPLDPQP
jgi:hypothetical protein